MVTMYKCECCGLEGPKELIFPHVDRCKGLFTDGNQLATSTNRPTTSTDSIVNKPLEADNKPFIWKREATLL